jgi:hypothetical protein
LHCIANPTSVLDLWTNKTITFYFSKWNDILNIITAITNQWWWVIRLTTENEHWLITWNKVPITNTTSYNNVYTITVIDTHNFDITETFITNETGNWQLINEKSSASVQIASKFKSSQLTVMTWEAFRTNDFAELWVENNLDWTWILIQNCNFLIN